VYLILLILICLLQVGDGLTTEHILNRGGKELNPIMNWLFTKFDMRNVLVVKALIVSLAAIFAYNYAPIALIPVAIIYVAVVGWNSYQIYKNK
jgi:hypothetical protein